MRKSTEENNGKKTEDKKSEGDAVDLSAVDAKELDKMSDDDLATLLGKEKSEKKDGSGKSGHSNADGKKKNGEGSEDLTEVEKLKEENEKLKQQVNEKESFYQKRENEFRSDIDDIRKRHDDMKSRFDKLEKGKDAKTQVEEITTQLEKVKKRLREGDLNETDRELLEDERDNLKLDLRDANKKAEEDRAMGDGKELADTARKMAINSLVEAGQHAYGHEMTSEEMAAAFKYQKEKKLPTFVNAVYEMKLEDTNKQIKELETERDGLKKELDTFTERLNEIKKKRGLISDNDGQRKRKVVDTFSEDEGSRSKTPRSRKQSDLRTQALETIEGDPDLLAELNLE